MSYIDVKQAKAHLLACLAKYPSSFSFGLMSAVHEICSLPTADVEEVVRCKDCKHFTIEDGDYYGWCRCPRILTNYNGEIYPEENFFCSYGERRTEE